MAKDVTICVGTLGQGIWRSADSGETWARTRGKDVPQGGPSGEAGNVVFRYIASESQVRALAAHPRDPRVIYAGTDSGVYRTEDRGEVWERLTSPMDHSQHGQHRVCSTTIWSLAIDPVDPDIIFAGTCPSAIYRTKDGGLNWEKLPVELAETCSNIEIPRVTTIAVDPVDHNNVWVGMEVDGVRRSRDGGDSWETVANGITHDDIHSIAIAPGPPKTCLIVTPRDIFSSTDEGESFDPLGAASKMAINSFRVLTVKPDDPQVVFLGNGQADYGGLGALYRSRDRGRSWETLPMYTAPNGTVWNFATHPSDPDYLLASSVNGQVFCSADGGDSWTKFRNEFGQVNALAWVPN